MQLNGRTWRFILPLTAWMAGASILQAQTVLFVDRGAPPGGDGLAWASAMDDLQDALESVSVVNCCSGGGCQIWVAAGTYTPDRGTGNRGHAFELTNCVTIYGGLAGDEDPLTFNPDDRDFAAHETILSGDLAGDDTPDLPAGLACHSGDGAQYEAGCDVFDGDIDGDVDASDLGIDENSYNVVRALDADSSAVLDGVTITAGNADGPCDAYCLGPGILVSGTPTLLNCHVTANIAHDGGGVGTLGAAPAIMNCRFTHNRAAAMGGAAVSFLPGAGPQFANCLWVSNHAAVGGSVFSNAVDNLGLSNCTASGNHAELSCGGVGFLDGSGAVSNSILWGNSDNSGSGTSLSQQFFAIGANVTVSYCSISEWEDPTNGNLEGDADPQFVDAANGDLRLGAGSPCIDAGNNQVVPPLPNTEPIINDSLAPGEWVCAAATYDGSFMRIYRNGVEVAITSKTGEIETDPAVPVWIGANPDVPTDRPWSGLIDEVAIFDYALTPTQLMDLQTAALVPSEPDAYPTAVMALGPVGYWRLGDPFTATVAADETGNHDGVYAGVLNPEELGVIENDDDTAVRFAGIDGYVDVSPLDITGTGLTLIAWFNADEFDHLPFHDGRLISKAQGLDNPDHYWMLSTIETLQDATTLRFRLRTNGETTVLLAELQDIIPPPPISYDLDFKPRFVDQFLVPDTGNPLGAGPLVDMGAYERVADCNGNGVPDDQDIGGISDDCNTNGVPDECEPDADGDGVTDQCDNCAYSSNGTQTDGDGDGYGNACDFCPNTIPGAPVDGNGCPPLIPGDLDFDGDVDGDDIETFESCATGPAIAPPPANCSAADLDKDNDVDHCDFSLLQRCLRGTDVLGDPNCAQ